MITVIFEAVVTQARRQEYPDIAAKTSDYCWSKSTGLFLSSASRALPIPTNFCRFPFGATRTPSGSGETIPNIWTRSGENDPAFSRTTRYASPKWYGIMTCSKERHRHSDASCEEVARANRRSFARRSLRRKSSASCKPAQQPEHAFHRRPPKA